MSDMKLFLSLEDAVKVCKYELECEYDEVIIRQELEQKCYISNDQYSIGYHDALEDATRTIRELGKV